ncbi:helix-turn-helix transcriptional regulator [Rhizobium binae]|nr:helix-turn-helix transcriptional regulator [Rhizobium binae]MBX4944936.1 helix-turn-helix transcriptional regulator [Rhizobium binae]MBX4968329.1 helix-turn-helix transcriptional regulator [Rhizobium binae]MBX4980239.1 helix-turn-helix transcriptional regulator [Rhizobium binae]
MIEALEDHADADAVRVFRDRLASGEEVLIPSEFVERLVNGENTVKAGREFRGMTVDELADKAGISVTDLLEIESDESAGNFGSIKNIAVALGISVDGLA